MLREFDGTTRSCLFSVLAIAGMFLTVSLLSSAIPGVNEPHYLCKARSFSDTAWCHRDFFLASSNAHYCFFWLLGPLTQYVSLTDVALIGRGISALLLASGWTVLGRELGLSFASRVVAAGGFAFLSQLGSFSGEWLLGGFESKVAAWGLGLGAVGFWIRGTVRSCPGWTTVSGICCGVGAMLHPVVGGWIAVCICMAWLNRLIAGLWDKFVRGRSPAVLGQSQTRLLEADAAGEHVSAAHVPGRPPDGSQTSVKSFMGIVAFSCVTIIVSLPGLVPALRMVLDDSLGRKDRERAAYIQVFWRLKHHLDPTELTAAQWFYAGGLLSLSLMIFVIVRRNGTSDPAMPGDDGRQLSSTMYSTEFALLMQFFFSSIVIAAAGVLVGWHTVDAQDMDGWEWRAALLKFYPFRTFDAMLPIAAGMLIALSLQQLFVNLRKSVSAGQTTSARGSIPGPQKRVKRQERLAVVLLVVIGGLPLIPAILQRETVPAGYTADQFSDWQAACEWIRTETPQNALFLTPRESFAFKWMAERAEYVCYKDCPQDAAGILEWNRRLWWLHSWTLQSSTDGTYDRTDLATLRAETGCDFIVTRILGPFETAPVWKGHDWQIIQLP